jgi:hypothetical protein
MVLEKVSKTVDFVQATTPSNANDGETYLDTSQSPPQLKVFDSSTNAFVRPRSIQNLDAPVSNAGATQTDIESGAERALEEDISQLSPASNSVAANLDGGVAAVDWSSKTVDFTSDFYGITSANQDAISVNGSGYLINISFTTKNGSDHGRIDIDGATVYDADVVNHMTVRYEDVNANQRYQQSTSVLFRFDSGFTLGSGSNINNQLVRVGVSYVLD